MNKNTLILATCLMLCLQHVVAQTTCGTTRDGVKYDFSSLTDTGSGWSGKDPDDNTYFFNVCGDVATKPSTCTDNGQSFQVAPPSSFCTVTGKSDQPTWSTTSDKISVKYGGGKACGTTPRTFRIDFMCDQSTKGSVEQVNEIPTGSCQYDVVFKTKLACAENNGGGKNGPSGPGGLSGGWIFFIILIVTTTVYCAAGIAYNVKQKGIPFGKEAVPQNEFWFSELPSLVKDGVTFTGQKIKGLSGKGGNYEKM